MGLMAHPETRENVVTAGRRPLFSRYCLCDSGARQGVPINMFIFRAEVRSVLK